jgi:hypothetical protein
MRTDAPSRPYADEALRIEEDAEYTAVVQFLAAQRNRAAHFWLGVPSAAFAAAAGAIALSGGSLGWAGALALASTLLTSVHTFVNPERRSATQHRLGVEYRALQSETRLFRTIELERLTDEERMARLAALSARRAELNRQGSAVPDRLFKKAQKKIGRGDTRHSVDASSPSSSQQTSGGGSS